MNWKKFFGWIGVALGILLITVLLVWAVILFSEIAEIEAEIEDKKSTIAELAEELKAATLPPVTPVPAEEEKEEIVKSDPVEFALIAGGMPAGELFQTPVQTIDVFNEESSWLIAEPGAILDDAATWVIPSVEAEHFANVPEGGFTPFSLGKGIITVDGVSLVLPGAKGLNYLVLIRGRIDDTIVDSDLNMTAMVVEFVPGHATWSIMPPGAYVSKDWFREQLVTSTTTGGTNCGATGCTTVHVVLFDVDSHFYQKFEVKAGDLDNWKLLESN
ncbi:hypothetical protein KKH23_02800 [Patescibacteria group bacterium]|nr:hypothetical protein [Patescibacteria group bacterium]MBU0777325.1 hypothetical protein [Patescibacteria group bacterium]MBU0846095.1 hypothetical protein [Patescibacteria group bacterium]MBU0923148.1 hypothetical protein [Patescibacteria group bacterium]MBU1066863.1 hypothetical protein [Patescibacteria group bacterium]